MSFQKRVIVGVGATVLSIGIALVIFVYYLVTESFPQTSGILQVPSLHSETKVYRDEYGVPHLLADTDRDAYFTVGFLHAQDRLWQLELLRRAGEGRLAEVLGEPALPIDRMFRTIGIWRHAVGAAKSIDEPTRHSLQAYAEGINSFLQSHKGKYPVEFDLLGIEPQPWSVEHSILISRLMAWELNYSRWVDITLGLLVERFGEAKASEIFPTWPEGAPIVVPDGIRDKKVAGLAMELLHADQAYRKLVGSGGFQSGSNAWAVSGAKSVTGKPLLANDPHLMLSAPGRWYELHVSTPGLDVAGATIVGVPFVIIGRNRHIAWGVTNAMMDDEDFYVEEADSIQHPTRYRFNNGWRPFEERIDTILVKDGRPILLTTYWTHRGPVVNRLEKAAAYSRNVISMRWMGHEQSNEPRAFFLLNRATNWREFREALRFFSVPAQNFVYADVEGNIGYHTGGKLPIRETKSPTLPFPGWTDKYDWKGFVPFDEMPHEFNPPEGFIATANNKIASDSYPHYISNLWEPHWRIARITELLKSKPKFSVEDFERMQNDLVSPHARELVPVILKAFAENEASDADLRTALTYFRNWDYRMNKEDVATTLFQSFFGRMIRHTFEDEMGPGLVALYDTLPGIPLSALTRLMQKGSSTWFDNIETPQVEGMNEIIRLSMENAVIDLRNLLGGELKEWQWGRLHTVEFPHVFGAEKLARTVFNRGPFPAGGSHSTVNNGHFTLGASYRETVGPSIRQIFDLSDVNNGRAVMPPGQSGQVFQKHYDDQLQLWLNGAYRQWTMDRSRIENANYELLILQPVR